MAFTRPWSDATPAGSVQAKTIDTEIQKVRVDVRERLDVEHNFPSADVANTGLHKQGSARITVDVYSTLVANLITPFATGGRAGRLQFSTDRQLLSYATDSNPSDIISARRFAGMSCILFAQLAAAAFTQSNTEVDLITPALLTELETDSIFGLFSSGSYITTGKVEARLIVVGTSTTTATTIISRITASTAISVVIATSGTLHIGAWTTLVQGITVQTYLHQQGTNPNAFTIYRVEIQFRILGT